MAVTFGSIHVKTLPTLQVFYGGYKTYCIHNDIPCAKSIIFAVLDK